MFVDQSEHRTAVVAEATFTCEVLQAPKEALPVIAVGHEAALRCHECLESRNGVVHRDASRSLRELVVVLAVHGRENLFRLAAVQITDTLNTKRLGDPFRNHVDATVGLVTLEHQLQPIEVDDALEELMPHERLIEIPIRRQERENPFLELRTVLNVPELREVEHAPQGVEVDLVAELGQIVGSTRCALAHPPRRRRTSVHQLQELRTAFGADVVPVEADADAQTACVVGVLAGRYPNRVAQIPQSQQHSADPRVNSSAMRAEGSIDVAKDRDDFRCR